ncbi:single-stranded DNA-binding protein [Aquisalimonas sp. 2447]|uniref:single-stranded DNA-binding protein n=1 Tax=Aquisalimonas sp. 2447 TaxID=2740807 RepID=UPI0014325B55|nr:single-stranded DNA-binding protein [Aquisalimonas sp. 2447]QIT56902.1 single-stranded DNA-binding protein [Aquisalimonas sp. 2447]
MTAQLAAWGRLGNEPRALETKTGKPMTVASLAVEVAEGGEAEWFGLVAFRKQAEQLASHSKGDRLSVAGRLQRQEWKGRDGEDRQQLQVIADSLVSARTVRPGGKKRKAPANGEGLEQARELYQAPDFDDELPI